MRTETRTVRIGEYLGPVDWSYDFSKHDSGGDPRYRATLLEKFKAMSEGFARGEKWRATVDGGSPRIGWGNVLEVGMYDGWPYWRPVPSFLLSTHMGAEWHSFSMLTDAKLADA